VETVPRCVLIWHVQLLLPSEDNVIKLRDLPGINIPKTRGCLQFPPFLKWVRGDFLKIWVNYYL
jgi:hypothetical protein